MGLGGKDAQWMRFFLFSVCYVLFVLLISMYMCAFAYLF